MTAQLNSACRQALVDYLLHLGDSDTVMSQRLCEWVGHAPALEEEVAMANVGLDLLGQARSWLSYAAELEDQGRDADQMAFLRDEREYRNLLITEQANGNFADTMARQFFFDAWHFHLLTALCQSTDAQVQAIARKGLKEVTYHLRRSTAWIKRLGDGTAVSHQKMQDAIDDIWTYTGEMFTAASTDPLLVEAGIVPASAPLQQQWLGYVQATLQEATLTCPDENAYMQIGGRQGLHTEQLGYLLAEMQFLPRAYPGATW
ncbi:phenylacetate-CoA oxygenase subunit PaaI [Pokkaliibacter plantistimulans]|uniref:Phenylacetate-CoA oxygenase subunit PaaI n=1 Tax=Proteobacteria bacterium 228 TaxID=2083153 RepID=A0A2S5KMT6_9PROT|nr:1,2-phenylacetyl-CoA epoxidase subunit PaaC [Pokkaliibacter plantistimulans]PPC76131.1 phenylacetate-CoA oxygenase subunit PaaI [Pokkaliibacter plantistimulans]